MYHKKKLFLISQKSESGFYLYTAMQQHFSPVACLVLFYLKINSFLNVSGVK